MSGNGCPPMGNNFRGQQGPISPRLLKENFSVFGVFRGQLPVSNDDPFPFQLGMMPEVDEQSQPKTRGIQIIDYLRPMFVRNRGDCLEFHEYQLKADKVGDITLLERPSLVR